MRRALVIVTTPFFEEKGSALRVKFILSQLSQRCQVDVITYSLGRDIDIPNVKIYRTPRWFQPVLKVSKPTIPRFFLDLFILVKAFNLLLGRKYDIIHAEDFEAGFIGYVLTRFFRVRAFNYDLHNRIVDNLRAEESSWLRRLVLWGEDKILSNVDQVILNWRLYEDDAVFQDIDKFLLFDNTSTDQEPLQIPFSGEYLAYTGNYEPYQGVLEFIEVFARTETSYKLVVAGKTTDELLALIDRLGVADRVHVAGLLTIGQCNYLVKNSLMGILPRTGGKAPGTKAISYISMGTPVLASNIPANREILVHEKNALLYNNEQELVEYLKSISKDKKLLSTLQQGVEETRKQLENMRGAEYFFENYMHGELQPAA